MNFIILHYLLSYLLPFVLSSLSCFLRWSIVASVIGIEHKKKIDKCTCKFLNSSSNCCGLSVMNFEF